MKITALTKHECECCRGTIKKGEQCFVWFTYPEDLSKAEFQPIYACVPCVNKDLCRDKLQKKGVSWLSF